MSAFEKRVVAGTVAFLIFTGLLVVYVEFFARHGDFRMLLTITLIMVTLIATCIFCPRK